MKKQSVLIIFSACMCAAVLANDNSSASSQEEISEQAASLFIQGLVNLGYSQDKLSAISDVIEEFSEDALFANVTLVGSQNVYNADGTLKEIRTIELALPYHLWTKFPESDYDYDYDDFDKLRKVREQIEDQHLLGIDMDYHYASRDSNGGVIGEFYIDKDTTAVNLYSYNILNQTIEVENKKEAEEFMNNIEPGAIKSSVLAFDKDGKYIDDRSTINTDLLVTLIEVNNESPIKDFIEDSKRALAKAYLSSRTPEEIQRKLQHYFDFDYDNDHAFTVIAGKPSGLYITQDYSITLRYNLVDLNEEPYYYIYGYKGD